MKVTLTDAQKRLVIEYVLRDPGKALFEDVPGFLGTLPDDADDECDMDYRDAVTVFVLETKQRLLRELQDPT